MWLLWWIKLHDHRVKLLFLYHRERECHNFFILYSHLNYSSQMLRVKMRVTVRARSLSLAQSFWRLCNLSFYFPSVSFLYFSFFMWRASFRSIHYIWEKILEECAAFPPLLPSRCSSPYPTPNPQHSPQTLGCLSLLIKVVPSFIISVTIKGTWLSTRTPCLLGYTWNASCFASYITYGVYAA